MCHEYGRGYRKKEKKAFELELHCNSSTTPSTELPLTQYTQKSHKRAPNFLLLPRTKEESVTKKFKLHFELVYTYVNM